MSVEILNELIENINKSTSTQQFDYIQKCMEILNISLTRFDKDTSKHQNLKDTYLDKIIKTIESRLEEEQLAYFHNALESYYLAFISNDEIKKNKIAELIADNKFYDVTDNKIILYVGELIISISDNQYKLDFYKKYESKIKSYQKAQIVASFTSDNIKLQYLEQFIDDEFDLSKIILSIKNDKLKLQLYQKYKDKLEDEITYKDILISLRSDELKLQYLKEQELNGKKRSTRDLINSLNTDSSLASLWDRADIECKSIILFKISEEDLKMEYLKKINDELGTENTHKEISDIKDILSTLSFENVKKVTLEFANITFSKLSLLYIIRKNEDEEFILDVLRTRGNRFLAKKVRQEHIISTKLIVEIIDLFLELEEVPNKEEVKACIFQMFSTNNDIVHTIEWSLLTSNYINSFGLGKLNILGSYPELEQLILEFNSQQFKAFTCCLEHYIATNQELDWNYAAYQLAKEIYFDYIDGKKIVEYITDFNTVNLNNLTHILLNGDNYGIESEDDINCYDKLIEEKCNKVMHGGTIEDKKDAIFIKYFGLSDKTNLLRGFRDQIKNGMCRIYRLYHTDIDQIEDNVIKSIFKFVKYVINCNSDEELQALYDKKISFSKIDTYYFETQIKNELLKLYNKELLQVSSLPKNEYGLYEAGTEFSIILNSVGAYIKNSPENYKEDWNRPSLASPHFCTNFIRNDMLGTAPVPHIMYGFSHMESYSLLLSGANDIYSSGASFISKAYSDEMYYGPENQINQTAFNNKYKYNEMDFRRIQNGSKKQPDYILVFRKAGIIDNIEEAKKASKQWDDLPIVVVDVDKCLENEYNKLRQLIDLFSDNPSIELFKQIKTKILNNRVTDSGFASSFNLEELKKMVPSTDETLNSDTQKQHNIY